MLRKPKLITTLSDGQLVDAEGWSDTAVLNTTFVNSDDQLVLLKIWQMFYAKTTATG